MKKFISILLLITILMIGYIQKDYLFQMVKQDGTYAVLISMTLAALCSFFPFFPFTIIAGVIGALFGSIKGMFISYTGAMAGTLLFFFICRYGFKDWARIKIEKYPKIEEIEERLNRNSFLAVLTGRLIPIFPAAVFNLACGLSKVKWQSFLFASAIGKIPNIVILSFAGANISRNIWFTITLYGFYLVVIFMINFMIFYPALTGSKTPTSRNE